MVKSWSCYHKGKEYSWHKSISAPQDEHHKLYKINTSQHHSPNKHHKMKTANTTVPYKHFKMNNTNSTKCGLYQHQKFKKKNKQHNMDTISITMREHQKDERFIEIEGFM